MFLTRDESLAIHPDRSSGLSMDATLSALFLMMLLCSLYEGS
jgi:hypothetical protein